MTKHIKSHPALSLLLLALTISSALSAPVYAERLPIDYALVAALGPGLAAIVLIWLSRGGLKVSSLLRRMLIWRVGMKWWLFVLLFPAIASVASLTLFNMVGGPVIDYSNLKPISSVLPMVVNLTIVVGLGEELGWRGYLLPRLQAVDNALYASIIVGAIWGLWHIPLFFLEGSVQSFWAIDIGLVPAVLLNIAFLVANAIQMGWVFNNTHGSVLLVAFMHGAQVAWVAGYIDVYRGEIGGVITFTAVMWVVSMIIVCIEGPMHLSRNVYRQIVQEELQLEPHS